MGKKRLDASYCRIDNIGRNAPLDSEYKSKSLLKLNTDIMNDNESIDIDHNNSAEDLHDCVGISSIHFPQADPIGTIAVAFDDGTIKVWQSSVNN